MKNEQVNNTLRLEPVDIVAIERRARAMQAQAMAEGLRMAVAWVARKVSSLRLAISGQAA